jgi:hypothetical protein
MNRNLLITAFVEAFMVIALAVLVGVCKNVTAEQSPVPTMPPTPGAVATFTPRATITLLVPTASSTPAGPTSTSTSTLTPLPTVTATQERRASEFSTPTAQPTLRPSFDPLGAPAQVPAQVPRRQP